MLKKFVLIYTLIVPCFSCLEMSLTVAKAEGHREIVDPLPVYSENPIVDGGIYFIVPYLNTNKCIDIPNSNYAVGTKSILYDCYGSSNQRFILEKSFEDYFRIRPLECNDLYLGIEYGQNSSNQLKLIADVDYDANRLVCDRFRFNYNQNLDCFLISTAISDDVKCLHPVSNSLLNNTFLEQGSLGQNTLLYFCWKLIKTNTLATNVSYSEFFYSNQTKVYYFHSQFDNSYKIKSTHSGSGSVLLEIYEDNQAHTLIYSSYSSFDYSTSISTCSANFDALKNTFVEVRISNLSSNNLSIHFCAYCDNQIAISTMVSFEAPPIIGLFPGFESYDSVTPFTSLYDDFEELGLYPRMQINMDGTSLVTNDVSGHKLINSQMFFEIIHGYPGGINFYDGEDFSNNYLTYLNMPNLDRVEVSFWGSCNSDTTPTDELGNPTGNSLARQAAENGALYSIGFRGTVLLWGMNTFVTSFFSKLNETNSVIDSACYAQQQVDEEWGGFLILAGGTKLGTLYIRSLGNIIRYDLDSQSVMSRLSDIDETTKNDEFYCYRNKKFLVYSGVSTNLEYNDAGSVNIAEKCLRDYEKSFLFKPNILINRETECLFLYFDSNSQYCYDCLNGECVHPADVMSIFKESIC